MWFAIHGANLNLDADGNVETVIDAGLIRDVYFAHVRGRGPRRPARHQGLTRSTATSSNKIQENCDSHLLREQVAVAGSGGEGLKGEGRL